MDNKLNYIDAGQIKKQCRKTYSIIALTLTVCYLLTFGIVQLVSYLFDSLLGLLADVTVIIKCFGNRCY